MTLVSGPLKIMTDKPSRVSEVWVGSPQTRPHGGGLLVEERDKVTPVGGVLSFTSVPGPVLLTLVSGGRVVDSVKGIVPDKPTATLAEVVRAAGLADAGTLSALEELALEVAADAARVGTAAQVGVWADQASEAASDAAEAASDASESASSASSAASTATAAANSTPGRVTTEINTQLPPKIDQLVPPKVAEVIGSDTVVRDAAAAAVDGALADMTVVRFSGSATDLNTALGSGANDRVYYSSLSSSLNSPSPHAALVDVAVSSNGRQFVQTFYRIDGPGVWKRNITDRTHIVPGQWIFGDWVRLDNHAVYRPLDPGENVDNLRQEGIHPIPSTGRGIIGLPAELGGSLLVHDTQNNTGNIASQILIGSIYSGGAETGIHFRSSRSSDGAWEPWRKVAEDDPNRMAPASARRAAVVAEGFKRRGGVIGTGGKPAIALRFDHHLAQFGDKVLPLLKTYRLPWGQMINPGNMGSGNDTWSWTELASECHQSGGEVWNHSNGHTDVTTTAHADREVTLSLTRLKDNLPSLWIDSWAPPGQSNYMGYEGQDTPEKHWDTYPGRLILAQHAFVRGYYPAPHHQLTGNNLIGQSHITIDAQTAPWCQSAIRSARDTGSGLTMMLHPTYLDQSGYMSTAELDQVFSYIAQLRDSGQIVVLSNVGILMADADRPPRNMLSTQRAPGTVTDWSETVTVRSTRATYGVPHEAEVWVTGSGQATLTVEIGSPTYPVTVSHTVTLTNTPQRLGVVLTPPLDTTSTTVSLTGTVTHEGIGYRPV